MKTMIPPQSVICILAECEVYIFEAVLRACKHATGSSVWSFVGNGFGLKDMALFSNWISISVLFVFVRYDVAYV